MRTCPSTSAAALLMSTPMRRMRSPCCARAAEKGDQLASFYLIELHSVPCQPNCRISN
jgi:hypothetical protein